MSDKHYRRQPMKEGDYLFDGFCHRGFNPDIDGWRNELPDEADYPPVAMAHDVLAMFQELCALRRELWMAKKRYRS